MLRNVAVHGELTQKSGANFGMDGNEGWEADGVLTCLWSCWTPPAKAHLWRNPVEFDGTCESSMNSGGGGGGAGRWGVSVRGCGRNLEDFSLVGGLEKVALDGCCWKPGDWDPIFQFLLGSRTEPVKIVIGKAAASRDRHIWSFLWFACGLVLLSVLRPDYRGEVFCLHSYGMV